MIGNSMLPIQQCILALPIKEWWMAAQDLSRQGCAKHLVWGYSSICATRQVSGGRGHLSVLCIDGRQVPKTVRGP